MCNSNDGIENAEHFLFNPFEYNVSQKINVDFHSFTPKVFIKILLYGNKKYKKDVNTYILNQTGGVLGKWPLGRQVLMNSSWGYRFVN